MKYNGRPSLQAVLDKDVYQIVTKFRDQDEYDLKSLTTDTVYNSIKSSNSSLKRRPKKQLEESIERVIDVMRAENDDDSDSVQGDFEGLEEPVVKPTKESNSINRMMVKGWGFKADKPSNGTAEAHETPRNTTREASPEKAVERMASGEAKPKRRKTERSSEKKEVDRSPPAGISFQSLGGVDDVLDELGELVALPLLNPEAYISTGIQPPRGVLLHGPPGCGKTMIANAVAAEVGVSFIPVSAPSLVAGMSGESEKKIRDLFEEAKRMAPCLVFIDEIDVIMGKRESAQREMEKRIVAQMLTCMDDLSLDKTDGKPVILIAATNRPDTLDPALRRAGRFNKEINLGVPNEQAREKILKALTSKLRLPDDFSYSTLAKMTPGFVGADLNDVVSVAGTEAMRRLVQVLRKEETTDLLSNPLIDSVAAQVPSISTAEGPLDSAMDIDTPADDLSPALRRFRNLVKNAGTPIQSENFAVTYADFLAAIPKVQPSAKREGFATIPDTTWAHIGALKAVREKLEMAIVEPIKRPEAFARVGITAPSGVLLWGPPGCGKTLLAKAVANESKANFISIKGPELLNKYVGESERAVRQVFERARSSVPCILFFDELDALVPKREDNLSEASSKVVNTLLTELDGLSSRAGIYVIAATNRPDQIDPAMLRPGRLGTSVYIDLPTPQDRTEILAALYRKALPSQPFHEVEEMLSRVALDVRCDGYSGADLGNLHQVAAIAALKRDGDSEDVRILGEDWDVALGEVKASVKDMVRYRNLGKRL